MRATRASQHFGDGRSDSRVLRLSAFERGIRFTEAEHFFAPLFVTHCPFGNNHALVRIGCIITGQPLGIALNRSAIAIGIILGILRKGWSSNEQERGGKGKAEHHAGFPGL